jgi:two-component system response regulator FixJ
MTPGPHEVLIVEDDPHARASYELLLSMEGFQVRGFASAEALLADIALAGAGCVLADLRLGAGMDGIGLVQALRERRPDLPVIMVTGHGDVPLAVRAMQAGARNFLEKPVHPQALVAAIRQAGAAGPRSDRSAEAEALVARLAPREREVLRALVAGHPNKVVAHQLGISTRTVETYRASIMDKLRIGSFAEMVRVGVAAGILE